MNVQWSLKTFQQLSVNELYRILQLRSEVFVVEQNCVFLDMDDKDQASHHLMGADKEGLVAYTRLVPPQVMYAEASIGRVVTSPRVRRTGIGKALMERSIQETYKLFGKQTIRIGAQLYLRKFYESLGFVQCSEVYLEDGIEHIYMLLQPAS